MTSTSAAAEVEAALAAFKKALTVQVYLEWDAAELGHLAVALDDIENSGHQTIDEAHKRWLRSCGITRVENVDDARENLREKLAIIDTKLASAEDRIAQARVKCASAMPAQASAAKRRRVGETTTTRTEAWDSVSTILHDTSAVDPETQNPQTASTALELHALVFDTLHRHASVAKASCRSS